MRRLTVLVGSRWRFSLSVWIAVWLWWGHAAWADGPLFGGNKFPSGQYSISIASGDLNGDGALDLAVANEHIHDVSVLLGNGDGTFAVGQRFGAGSQPLSIAIGDLNGDGALDLAVANYASDDVSVLLGSGDGTFQAEQRFQTGGLPHSVAMGDLNGDGALDLAVANFDSDNISVLLGNGDGTFQVEQLLGAGSGPDAIAIGDLNGDGALDLAVTNLWGYDVSVLPGNGDGTFQTERRFGVGIGPRSIAIGDLNADGKSDLAIGNLGSHDVSVLLGNGDGTFQPEQRSASGNAPFSIAIRELNDDGALDLAITNPVSDEVSVLRGNGDGTFQVEQRFGAGQDPRAIAIGDLNGDGGPDLAVANFAGDVSVLLGDGDGIFYAQRRFAAGDRPWSVAIGDLNGDGASDLAIANSTGDDVSVLLGNGDETFQAEQRFGAGDFPSAIAIGDLNGDGAADLAVANTYSNDASVLLGNGDGTVQAEARLGVGEGPRAIAIGDLNGDGAMDLAVANSTSDDVSVLLGNGDGSFQGARQFGVGAYPVAIAIGDLNGDAALDLAVANEHSHEVSVLLGNGEGAFQAAGQFEAGNGPYSIAIRDLNGDGASDLAVANLFIGGDLVSVLLGNGNGTFQAARQFRAGDEPHSIGIGDLDGDGTPDLAVANYLSCDVAVLLGNGDGTFQDEQRFGAGSGPYAVAIADLNGDDALDLAVANVGNNDVSVLINLPGKHSEHTLTVSVAGSATVTSRDGGINCRADCEADYPEGTQVDLQAIPDPDWIFEGWGGVCSGTGTCSLTVSEDQSVTARFSRARACPASVVVAQEAGPIDSLTLAYTVRDRLLPTLPGGDWMVDAYYRHSAEVALRLLGDGALRGQASDLLRRLRPRLQAALGGAALQLEAPERIALARFVHSLREQASVSLRADLKTFLGMLLNSSYKEAERPDDGSTFQTNNGIEPDASDNHHDETAPQDSFWDNVKENANPGIEIPSEFGTAAIANNATLGWEDGVYISRNGLHLFAFYAPVDIIKFGEYFVSRPDCPIISPFLRGPTLTMDLDLEAPFANPGGCTNGYMHSTIAVASRPTVGDGFAAWSVSDVSVDFQYSGGYEATDDGQSGYDIVFSRTTVSNRNDLYWVRNASDIDPSDPETTPLPSPINSRGQEDNPHLERIDSDHLVLLFDTDGGGGPDTTIKYALSADKGTTWSNPKLLSTINGDTSVELHGHLWNDGTDWWLYFTSSRHDFYGLIEIFRSKHNSNDLIGDFDNWGAAELVISRGFISDGSAWIAGVADPTLTTTGDISFTVIYCRNEDTEFDRCEIDPWYLPRLPE